MPSKKPEDKKGLATASLVIGIIALLGAFSASLSNIFSVLLLSMLAIIFGMSAINKTSRKRSANFGVIFGITSFVIALLMTFIPVAYQNLQDRAGASTLESELQSIAESAQPELPVIDNAQTITSVEAVGETLVYGSTVSAEVDEAAFAAHDKRTPLITELCGAAWSRELLDVGATFTYNYMHATSGGLYSETITKTDCSV